MSKNILITGITSGIGLYLTNKLSDENNLIGVGRKDKPEIENIKYLKGDIRDLDFLKDISDSIETIDYLIINAGVGYFDDFKNITIEQNKEIIETNLLSPILLINLLLEQNKIKSGIIFIGSTAGKKSMKYGASYGASKFGLRGFAMQLKNELKGIKTHLVNPKIVDTGFHKNSKIEINGKYQETKLGSIYNMINDIITLKEKRFEIDL